MVKKATAKKKAAPKKAAPKKAAAKKKAAPKKKTAKKTKAAVKKAAAPSKRKTGPKKEPKMTHREEMIQQIKQTLMSQRESLLKEAEETLNSLPGEINFPDMGDQATAETDRNFMLRLRDRERMLLKKIDETIERANSKDFGKCEECGNEIGIKRLEARPVTTLCIDCKTRQEEEERIAGGG
jgi:DnaK suppressor protein